MKTISNHIRMSAFSLVLPALFNAYSASAYASLIDISQSQAYGSEPAALGSVLAGQELPNHPYQTAAVRFITDEYGKKQFNGGSSQSAQDFTTEGLCANAGYRIKSCPSGYVKGEACPDDGSFVRECIDPESWCRGNGYTVTKCEVPSYPAEACPHSGAYYRSCQDDNIRACKEAGYSLTCETGKVGDNAQVCPYNSSYKKCVCNPCKGYDYTAEQANAQGYLPGDVCNSCGSAKYKRTANPCDGFKECTNGGTVGAEVCFSGSVKKFSQCDDGCDPKFNTRREDCTGDYVVDSSQGFCQGKYIGCERAARVVYGDGTVGMVSERLANKTKTPIAIVVDAENRLAVALTNITEADNLVDKKVRFASGINQTLEMQRWEDYNICRSDSGQSNTNILLQADGDTVMKAPFEAAELVYNYEAAGCSAAFCRKGNWFLPSMSEWRKYNSEKEFILNMAHELYGYVENALQNKMIDDIKGVYDQGFYRQTSVWLAQDAIGFFNGQWNYLAKDSANLQSGGASEWSDLRSVRPFIKY